MSEQFILPPGVTSRFGEIKTSFECDMGPGWILIAIVPHDDVMQGSSQHVTPQPNSSYPNITNYYTAHALRRVKYVFGKTREDVIEGLKRERDEALTNARNAAKASEHSLKELNKALEEAKDWKDSHAQVAADASKCSKQRDEAWAANNKLEADLAKVRQYIGDAKWKEITGK